MVDLPDLDDSDVEAAQYITGKCFALAYAIHCETGWIIEGKIERFPTEGEPSSSTVPAEYAAHFWVLPPDGRAIDVSGPCSREDMIASFGTSDGEVRQFCSETLEEFCEVDDDDPCDSFWSDVAEATEYLDRHRDVIFGDIPLTPRHR